MTKKILSLVVAALMVLALVPMSVFAAETPTKDLTLDEAANAEGSSIHFESEGTYPWTVVEDETDANHPNYVKSGNKGVNSSESEMTATFTAEASGKFSFDFQAFGEGTSSIWDKCIFTVDGVVKFTKGAEYDKGWQNYELDLTAGEHTFSWKFTKDSSVAGTGDCFSVDNVKFVPYIAGEFTLTINYVYLNGTQAAPAYTGTFATDEDYSVDSPEITGWTPDIAVVEGTMGYADVEVTVTYYPPDASNLNEALNVEGGNIVFSTIGSYPWTVEHYYAVSGNKGVNSSESVLTASVNVTSETAVLSFNFKAWGEGADSYDWDKCQFKVDGVIATGTVNGTNVTFNYGAHNNENWETFSCELEKGEHTLTWTFKKDSSQAGAGDYFAVDEVAINGEYENVIVKNTLTINYVYVDGTEAAATYTTELETGETYSVTSPEVAGYVPDIAVVEGTMGLDDITVTVTYDLPPAANLNEALNVEGGTIEFTSEGNYPWHVEKRYAVSGNKGVSSSESVLSASIKVLSETATLSFNFKAWGEGSSWDVCVFAIDGDIQFSYGNRDNDWETVTYELAKGVHVLTWTYSKDNTTNPTGDYFAVDEVAIDGEYENYIPVPEEINVEDVTVYVGYSVAASYELLPAVAPQGVTFEIADETFVYYDETLGAFVGRSAGTTTYVVRSTFDPTIVSAPATITVKDVSTEGTATIVLVIPESASALGIWGDGSGYQLLLDADHNTYGTVIPASGSLTNSGDASDEVYAEFEYKLPANADGALDTTNVLVEGTLSIEIPAGTYDFCITNPTPGDRVWIASDGGNMGGRGDDVVFCAGETYTVTITIDSETQNDRTDADVMPLFPDDEVEVAPIAIDAVEITGLVVPAYGEAPAYGFAVPAAANYTVSGYTWYADLTAMGEGDTFSSTTTNYYVTVILNPAEGYAFADDCTVTLTDADNNDHFSTKLLASGALYVTSENFTVVAPPEPEYIYNVDFVEFTAPVYGELPMATIAVADGAHYTATIEWVGDLAADGTFAYNTYHAVITVVPESGYEFFSTYGVYVGTEQFAVASKTIDANGNAVITTNDYELVEPAPDPISTVAVYGFAAPAYNEAPAEMYVSGLANYTLESAAWYADGIDLIVTVFDDIDADYYATIVLVPNDGFAFVDPAVTINGETSNIESAVVGADGKLTITTVFFNVELPTIDTIELSGFVAPVEGANPSFNIVSANESLYTVTEVKWFDAEHPSVVLTADDTFAAGEYYAKITVAPAAGYQFAADYTIDMDGSVFSVNSKLLVSGNAVILTNDYEVKHVITSITINDFVLPVWGAAPAAVTVDVDEPYGVTTYWQANGVNMAEGDTFNSESTEYSLRMVFNPVLHYEFAPAADLTVTMDGYTGTFSVTLLNGNVTVITDNFTVVEPVIEYIELTGLVLPVVGEMPDYNIVPADAHAPYTVESVEWINADGLFTGVHFAADGSFMVGEYYLKIVVAPADGYTIDEDYLVYMDNAILPTVNKTIDTDGRAVITSDDYECSGLITEINIDGFVLPEWDGTPAALTVAVEEPYSISFEWQADGSAMAADAVFSSETTGYSLYITITPMLHYGFAPVADITINMAGYTGTYPTVIVYDGTLRIFTESMYVVEPVVPTEEPTVVNALEFTGFVAPVLGEAPCFDIVAVDGAVYHVDNVQWFNADTYEELTAASVFGYGRYYVKVSFSLNDGVENTVFAENYTVTMDGADFAPSTHTSYFFTSENYEFTAPAVPVTVEITQISWRAHTPEDGKQDLRFLATGEYADVMVEEVSEIGYELTLGSYATQTIDCCLRFFEVNGLTFSYTLYVNNIPEAAGNMTLTAVPYVKLGGETYVGAAVSDIIDNLVPANNN